MLDRETQTDRIFFDASLNQISFSNVSASSSQTIEYTKEELDDDNNYVDNSGWNRFTVNHWKL